MVMAHVGFPWHSRTSEAKKSLVGGPQNDTKETAGDPEKPLSDFTNKRGPGNPSLMDEKAAIHGYGKGRAQPTSLSSTARSTLMASEEAKPAEKAHSRLPVRTIPPWIQSAREEDLVSGSDAISFPDNPNAALIAQHNHTPATAKDPFLKAQNAKRREGHPLSSGQTRTEPTSRWITFARASAYPSEHFHTEKVDQEWLDEHFGNYSEPWLANHNEDDIEDDSSRYHAFRKKRQVWYKRSQRTILRNPFIPLVFRLIVFTFAATALALGGSIHHITDAYNDRNANDPIHQGPSTLMAIIVDAIALVYIVWVTYDEYFNKPLGLRSARAKVRIVLLDLFFIVFQAANLSLAFQGLSDTAEGCKSDINAEPGSQSGTDASICERQRALASVLLIALIAWLMTFSVSIFRLVERINQR